MSLFVFHPNDFSTAGASSAYEYQLRRFDKRTNLSLVERIMNTMARRVPIILSAMRDSSVEMTPVSWEEQRQWAERILGIFPFDTYNRTVRK
jgi:hypothetical protein